MNLKQHITPQNLFTLSMMLIGAGLSTSNSLMTFGQIGLAIAFFWRKDFMKLPKVFKHKGVLTLILVYLLIAFGLIHSSNWEYGLHDIKIKLPLITIPLLVAGCYPLSNKDIKLIFHSVYLGVIIAIGMGLLIYLGWVPWKVVDMRSYSPFISNVRLGTILVFCIFLSSWLWTKKELRFFPKAGYGIIAVVCLAFLFVIQSLTGLAALGITQIVLSLHALLDSRTRKNGLAFLIGFAILVIPLTWLTIREYHRANDIEVVDFSNLPYSTPDGAIYKHDTLSKVTVNGHYTWIYVCNWELQREWGKRSELDFHGSTRNGWPLRSVLVSYITSKGQKKNAEAVQQLSDKEIKAIENGADNFLRVHPLDFRWRIHQLFVEMKDYQLSNNPNGKSFATRLELWKLAESGIMKSPLIGHGTGDVNDILDQERKQSGSLLSSEHKYNPHQQFLTIALGIGIPGMLIFTILIFWPFLKFRKLEFIFLAALSIFFVGMLDEDMLETQAGATQFVFIYIVTYFIHKSRLANQ